MTTATPVTPAPRQIVLVGLSGVGKSTVGRLLAQRLGWTYVDTDDLVTAREGKTPAEIITTRGEPAFRDIESKVVAEAVRQESVVIATGGGAFQRGANRRALGERGLICFLDAMPTEIARRLQLDTTPRPLVDGDLEANLARLDAERRPTYNHADVWVPVQGAPDQRDQTTETAVARILRAWATDGATLIAKPRRLERLGLDEPARGPAALVDTGLQRYPIWVASGELRRLPDRLRQIGLDGRRVFLISDTSVIEAHGRTVAESLDTAGIPGASYVIPAGEASKSQRTASELYAWLASERAERRDVILALGGGVVGDLAGYVAATYLRGMPVVQLPTSVLAMNDAAIGGKVAVDLPAGKNLVGAFHQPAAVISDIETLRTLPRRSYIEGFAEVIKHGLILDPALLGLLERESARIASPAPDLDLVAEVVARSSRVKALIVSSDPEERGIRAILNYGHTTGHGIEQATGYTEYMHGEAVSVGMMAAGRIGVELGTMDQALLDRQADLLRAFGLPTAAPGVNVTAVLDAMKRDKKVEQGRLRFVLLEGPGRAIVRGDVPEDLVARTVQSVLRG
ncbi:MAG: 3-dehydroquinate synthase [Dehalococcoidia bacterium]|nr:MAG: 3-dehydroquinate synthase [Dehalococcoidia bacterium]